MATSNAELQAEIDRILRMAVRLEPVDLRYDVNKDGRVSSADAYLVSSGAATIPPPPAPVVQQPWWAGQFASEADANFVDTNRNQQIEETERAAWRSQYDPNSTEYQQRVANEIQTRIQAELAASQEGRIYNNQIYPTREAADQASYNDALSQGRVYNNKVYTTKALADLAKSFDQANVAAEQEREQIRLADELYQQNYQNELKAYAEGRVYNNKIYATQQEAQSAKKNDYVLQQANFIQKQIGRDLSQQDIENLTKVVDKYVQDGEEPLNSYTNLIFQDFATQFGSNQDKQKYDEFRDNFIIERIKSQLKRELSPTEISQAKAQDLDIGNFANISNYATSASELETLRQAALQGGNIFGVTGQNLSDVVPIYSGLNQYDPNSGKSVIEYLLESNPKIRQSTEGYSSTFVKTLKNVNGQLVEVDPKGVSQQDLKSGNVYFSIAADDPTDPDYTRRVAYYQAKGDILQPLKNPEDSSPLGGTFFGEQPKTLRDQFFEALPGIMAIGFSAIPGLGQALGASMLPAGVSAATAQAFGSAVINAGMQVAQGVPIEKAILNSAASFGVSQFVPNISGNVYIDNAVRSVATATLTGGDVGKALANSLISTGGNEFFKDASFTGDKVVDSAIASAITSGVQAAATDGDVGASIIRGGIAGASGQLTKEEKMAESAKSGAGFIGEDVTEPTSVAESGIDPRILAQGVTGGQFGEGGLLQTGGNIGVNVLPPNPQSEFGVQKNINARADFNESSLGAKYGEINSPHWGKLISSIMINDVVDSNGNPIDTPVGYYAIYDPDTNSTFYEFSLSDGTTVTSKTRPFVEQGKIFSEDKFFELKPSRQPSELNIDTSAGNGAFLGETQDLAEEPTTSITVSASKPTIDQRLLDLIEQAPDQESATNATVAYYQALDNDLSDDEALNAARTAMQAKSPPILFEDSVVEQKPTEQQVADTGLTVVGQPADQTPVVSPTAPSVTTPITSPVVTEPVVARPVVPEPVVTEPPVTEPVVTQPPVTEPVVPEPVVTEPPIAQPVITQPVVTTPPVLTPEQIAAQELDAEVQKIMRMAVKKDPVDMRYDLNKDGRVNVIDALALKRGQATVPTVEEYQASLAQQTVAPQPEIAEPPITQPAVTEPVTQEPLTQDIVTTAPSTTPSVTQPVEQTPSVEPPSPPPIVEPTPPTSEVTGIVLQNNGDGTALVLTNDGNATNVPVTDAVSNEPLTPGASVTVDQNTNTATVTPPVTEVSTPEPVTPVPPTVEDTGDQQVIGGGQEPTTDAGTVFNTPIGPDTYTPPPPEPVVPEPPPPPPEVPTTPQEPVVDKTEEDLLLEQIIQELETKPPVSEGVPIPEPEFPEPPLVVPESPTINVGDSLTVRPRVDLTVRPRVERRVTRRSVSPGSRVEESAQILPLRPGLSEGGTGGIEGTTEQEQEPVWNVRSLKLRRLLGI